MAIQPPPAADRLLAGSVQHSVSCKVARLGDENVRNFRSHGLAHEGGEVAAVISLGRLVVDVLVVQRDGLAALGAVHDHDLGVAALLARGFGARTLAAGLVMAACFA